MAQQRPPPQFEKKSHHVVPAGWQRWFFAMGGNGERASAGYYKDIVWGRRLGPIGVGERIAQEYANIVFDAHYRPTDELEDRLAKVEGKAISGLDRVVAEQVDRPCRAHRHCVPLGAASQQIPGSFQHRGSISRNILLLRSARSTASRTPLALTVGSAHRDFFPELSFQMQIFLLSPPLPRTAATEPSMPSSRPMASNHTLNPGLLIDGALRTAEHLTALEWHLIEANTPSFLLSDHPSPQTWLHICRGVDRLFRAQAQPSATAGDRHNGRSPRLAPPSEIDAINREVRSRAVRWICGPAPWVHNW